MLKELDLPLLFEPKQTPAAFSPKTLCFDHFVEDIRTFREFGTETRETITRFSTGNETESEVPTFINEFWTAAQRDANNLHEVSYRACFKPQLPRFFIERLTNPRDIVYDPFMGRGTTLIEAAFLNRIPAGNDINPLSAVLVRPRLRVPSLEQIRERLEQIQWKKNVETRDDLLVFYHPETLREITALKEYFAERELNGNLDPADDWIRMVTVNRLTGHSAGFFSVYTLPPNQAVSIKSQEKINRDRKQVPPRRSVPDLILRKSRSLLKDLTPERLATLHQVGEKALLANAPAAQTSSLPAGTFSLVVTSPPFLNVVQYATDNWLRCWFIGVDAEKVKLTIPNKLEQWQAEMTNVFRELRRVLKQSGHIAFEVGEVRNGRIKLEETVLRCGTDAGLEPLLVLINDQEFTKTANCWGVQNNSKGTNTNRIVLFRKN